MIDNILTYRVRSDHGILNNLLNHYSYMEYRAD